MRKTFTTIILLFLFFNAANAETAYRINIDFTGAIDSTVILASYYGNSFQVIDTINLKNNKATITGSTPLNQGVYTIARLDKSKYFDFIIGDKPFFDIKANSKNFIDSIKFTDSPENEFFYKYFQLNTKLFQLNQKAKEKNTIDDDLQFERDFILSELQLLKSNVHKEAPNSVLDIIFTSMQEPEIPEHISSNNTKRYEYFKTVYWDLIALNDARMLRTPVFHNKLDYFFDRIVMQQPDSLASEIDRFFKKEIHPEIYKYIIWDLAMKYEHPKIMGLDKVFVHLVDNYYKKGKVKDISQGIIDTMIERAEKIKPLLLGETAPNLIMIDTLGNFDALNNYFKKDYMLVLFWDSDCQTCQTEMRELKKLYSADDCNFEVFAVNTEANHGSWKKYIREHDYRWVNVNGTKSITPDYHKLFNIYSTPTIYILDKHKKIIGKNLSVGQLPGFLENYEARKRIMN